MSETPKKGYWMGMVDVTGSVGTDLGFAVAKAITLACPKS